MTLTKTDKNWILEAVSELLSFTEDKFDKKLEEKISHLPTIEQMNSMKDEILTELRKVRTEQEFIGSKVYQDLEPRVKALEENQN